MHYTKQDVQKLLETAVNDLIENPACNIPEEELQRRCAEYTQDRNLEILTQMLNAREKGAAQETASGEGKRKD